VMTSSSFSAATGCWAVGSVASGIKGTRPADSISQKVKRKR
jgi:hypothetical protein